MDRFIDNILAIQARDEMNKSHLAYMVRALVKATLPHSKPDGFYFERKNGHLTLSMIANPKFGLPYGSIPRMLLAWITTEAVSKSSPEVYLGNTLTSFLKKLKLRHGGGKRGNATRVRKQMLRLLTCKISCIYENKREGICEADEFTISKSFKLLWDPIKAKQDEFLEGSKIILSADFFDELIKNPVPINFDTLMLLRQSPMQIDIYVWLTHRFYSLQKETLIPWQALKNQFGSNFESSESDPTRGIRNFKTKFLQALRKVMAVYQTANVCPSDKGLMLLPSETHVKKVKKGQRKNMLSVDN